MRNTCAITEYNECVTVTVSSIKLVYMLMYKRRTETCTVCCLWIPAKAQHGDDYIRMIKFLLILAYVAQAQNVKIGQKAHSSRNL